MRYIKGENYYTYFKATRKPEGGIILNDFKYGTTEFEPTSELFERTKQNYSYFGRKRRLPESKSPNKGASKHAVRSGVNFLVQSVASDINVLGVIDTINPKR